VVNHIEAGSAISILNDVIGPVMRGPSSSHTAGSFHIGRIVASLFGAAPLRVRVAFDPAGSYGQVYREQGVDLGFAMGLIGLSLQDERFFRGLEEVRSRGIDLAFEIRPLEEPDHPNTTDIEVFGPDGRSLRIRARSIGGGLVEITRVDGWPVVLNGQAHEILAEFPETEEGLVRGLLAGDGTLQRAPEKQVRQGRTLLVARRRAPLPGESVERIRAVPGASFRASSPIAFVHQGPPWFRSAAEMIALAESRNCALGKVALAHEASVLGIEEGAVFEEMGRRVDLMLASVARGLGPEVPHMQLLSPTAGKIFRAEKEGRLAVGGLHTRAAARAMAVMQVNSGMGVVCAAPTGGSAGVLPAVLATLMQEKGISRGQAVLAAMAAGAIGVIVATRATFAAEVAGCQVEIGAAGAMAAAAVVEAAQGTARQAANAAAISFQNTMGSVCDLVQGMVEIPCHTRNAVAASSALVCADLVLGGYCNPIPLDETIDAVLAVGKMLPAELRVTSLGGLAATPSALNLRRRFRTE
jgi:L-serine dehydratase